MLNKLRYNIHKYSLCTKSMSKISNNQDKIPKNSKNNFLHRINIILGEKKINPWGAAIGLSHGTIARMKKGSSPASDSLSAISRAENVSISWLLTGTGSPYLVNNAANDIDALEIYKMLIEESGWDYTIITDGNNFAVVLSKPGTFESNTGKVIQYQIIETISHVGPLTLKAILNKAKTVVIESNEFNALSTGWMSNQKIVKIITRQSKQDIFKTDQKFQQGSFNIGEEKAIYSIKPKQIEQLFSTLPEQDKSHIIEWINVLSNNLLLRCISEVESAVKKRNLTLNRHEIHTMAQKVYVLAREADLTANQVANVIDINDVLI